MSVTTPKTTRSIKVDKKALRFIFQGGQINCFWRDILRWPVKRFKKSLAKGVACYVKNGR